MGTIIVQVDGGIATPMDDDDDILIIDWDTDDWSYDAAVSNISAIIDSDYDGPQQLKLIKKIVDRTLDDWGETL